MMRTATKTLTLEVVMAVMTCAKPRWISTGGSRATRSNGSLSFFLIPFFYLFSFLFHSLCPPSPLWVPCHIAILHFPSHTVSICTSYVFLCLSAVPVDWLKPGEPAAVIFLLLDHCISCDQTAAPPPLKGHLVDNSGGEGVSLWYSCYPVY